MQDDLDTETLEGPLDFEERLCDTDERRLDKLSLAKTYLQVVYLPCDNSEQDYCLKD